MRPAVVLGALALLCAQAASSQTANDTPKHGVSLTGERNALSDGLPDWHEVALRYDLLLGERKSADLALARTSRFDLDDTEWRAAYATPLMPQVSGAFEATYSPTHRVLPRRGVGALLGYEFRRAWLAYGGFKTTRYATGDVYQGRLMLEHYFSDFSASATWLPGHALGENANVFELRGSYYYADGSNVGLLVSDGDEATETATGVVLTDVRSFALTGRHRLSPAWSATYALSYAIQGDLYRRTGVSLGVRYAY